MANNQRDPDVILHNELPMESDAFMIPLKELDPVTKQIVKRYEAGAACLASFAALLQLIFVAIKVASHSAENAIEWAVVFIPGYIFFLIWLITIFYVPYISGAWHVWYVFSPWMIMVATFLTTGAAFCMTVAHLQDWWRVNIEWGLFIPLMILAAYLSVLFGYIYLHESGWLKKNNDGRRTLTGSEYVSMSAQQTDQNVLYD